MTYQSPVSPGYSWYEATVGARPEYDPLDGDRRCDVVIVGGGFTGLSAAAHLAKAGSDKSKVVSVNIWLAAIGDFDAMNVVYDAWVDKANPPVRACVEARLAGSEFAVEIAAIAQR